MKYLFLAVVSLLLISGCGGSDSTAPQAKANQPTGNGPNGTQMISFDEAFARPDLPRGTLRELKRLQSEGRQITQSYLDHLIKKHTPKKTPGQAIREHQSERLQISEVLTQDLPQTVSKKLVELKKKQKTITRGTLTAMVDGAKRAESLAKVKQPTTAKTKFQPREYKYAANMRPSGFDFISARAEYYQIAVDHFKSKTIDEVTPEEKRQADELIQKVFDRDFYPPRTEEIYSWIVEADKLAGDNSGLNRDPLFLMVRGKCLGLHGQYNKCCEVLDESLKLFKSSDYPARVVVYTNWLFMGYSPSITNPRFNPHHFKRYFDAILYWLESDFRAEKKFHAHVVNDIEMFLARNSKQTELLDAFHKAFSANTNLPPWIRAVVKGQYFHMRAWQHRGSGLAHTVSDEGWKKFAELEEKAASYLKQAYKLNPHFPEAATALIEISRAGHTDESQDHWFEAAIEAAPNHYDAYENRIFGLYPQWGGSFEEMLDFALKHSLKAGEHSPVPFMAVDCFLAIDGTDMISREEKKSLLGDLETKKKILAAVDKLIASDRGPIIADNLTSKEFSLTCKAVLATRLGQMEEAHEAFERLENGYIWRAATLCGVGSGTFASFRAPAFALTSEYQNEAKELRQLASGGFEQRIKNSRKIIDLAERVLAENSDPIGSLFFKQVLEKVRKERAYDRDQEVNLTFDPALLNWSASDILPVKFDTENSVFVDSRVIPENHYYLYSKLYLEGPKRIEFDLEFPDPEQEGANRVSDLAPTVVIGNFDDHEAKDRTFGIAFQRLYKVLKHGTKEYDGGRIYFQSTDHLKLGLFKTVDMPLKNKVKILVDKAYFEVYLNNKFIVRSRTRQCKTPVRNLAFTKLQARKGKAQVKFSNIRIKKWKAPTFRSSKEEMLEYYEKAVETDSKDQWNTFWLGNAHHAVGNLKEAQKSYEKAIELGLPKHRAAFFLGDIKEKEGDLESALELYRMASANENASCTFYVVSNSTYTTHEHWASFRLAWYNMFSPDGDRKHDWVKYAAAYCPGKVDWVQSALAAQYRAVIGEFDVALENINKALPDCPAEFEAELVAMKQAYQMEKVYQPKNDKPFYLRLENPIHFFPSLEDNLPARFLTGWDYKGHDINE